MGKIRDFFRKIFGKQPKMLNSGDKEELIENITVPENNVKEETEVKGLQVLSFRDEIRKQAEVSKIDPSRYQSTPDLYMAILEEMGASENFKNNPRAKADLTRMITDIIREQPKYLQDEYLKLKTESNSKSLMKLLEENGVKVDGKEIRYNEPFVRNLGLAEGVCGSKNVSTIFSDLDDGYTKNQRFNSIIYDDRNGIAEKGIQSQCDIIKKYDKNGIEIEEKYLDYADSEAKGRHYNDKGAVCPNNFIFLSKHNAKIKHERTVTRCSSFKGNEKSLADFMTVEINVCDNGRSVFGGTCTIDDMSRCEDLRASNYDHFFEIFRNGSVDEKMALDRFHNPNGTPVGNNLVEAEIMPLISSREKDEGRCDILRNGIAKIMGKDENSKEIDD